MEKRTLNPEESLELITRMIRDTRTRLECNAERPFLIWGYVTVVVSLFNYAANVCGWSPSWAYTWFAIPVLGGLLTHLIPTKKSDIPRTEIDRIVGMVWMVCSLAQFPVFISVICHGLSYRTSLYATVAFVMAIGTAITGLIIRSRIFSVAGFAGMAMISAISLYDLWLKTYVAALPQHPDNGEMAQLLSNEILIFAAIFVVMMIIPGHITAHRNRNRKN